MFLFSLYQCLVFAFARPRFGRWSVTPSPHPTFPPHESRVTCTHTTCFFFTCKYHKPFGIQPHEHVGSTRHFPSNAIDPSTPHPLLKDPFAPENKERRGTGRATEHFLSSWRVYDSAPDANISTRSTVYIISYFCTSGTQTTHARHKRTQHVAVLEQPRQRKENTTGCTAVQGLKPRQPLYRQRQLHDNVATHSASQLLRQVAQALEKEAVLRRLVRQHVDVRGA